METPILLLLGLVGTGIFMKNEKDKAENFKLAQLQKDVENGQEGGESNQISINNGDWKQGYANMVDSKITPYFFNNLKDEYRKSKIVKNNNYNPDLLKTVTPDIKVSLDKFQQISDNTELINASNTKVDYNDWKTLIEDKGDLKHSNMVPFFGSKITQNVDTGDHSRKLDTFTGNMPLNKDHKKETKQFFDPTPGFTNVFGYYEKDRDMTRYVPNNIGKKNNELPFEQTYVGPGLDNGYTNKPTGGYHNMYRTEPKPNDELYVNPKMENKGRVHSSKAMVQKRAMEQIVRKNRAELLVTNENGERNFTTVGDKREMIAVPEYIIRDTHNKNNKTMLNGKAPAACVKVTDESLMPKTRKSIKRNFENTPYRNLTRSLSKKSGDYGKKGFVVKPNERMTTGKVPLNQVITGDKIQSAIRYYDKSRSTRKEAFIDNQRLEGNVGINGQAPIRHNDKVKETIRQSTENTVRNGNIGIVNAANAISQWSMYNAEINNVKEAGVAAKPVQKNGPNRPLSNEDITLEISNTDVENDRSMAMNGAAMGNNFTSNFITEQSLTREKDDSPNQRLQEQFTNPLTRAFMKT